MTNLETYNKVVAVGVDIQNDFCPGGSLAVENGDKIVTPFNKVMSWTRAQHNGLVTLTRDWHPEETNHFSETPNFTTTWPVHCVAHSLGAEFNPNLDVQEEDVQLFKGTLKDEDAYSGFQAHAHCGLTLEGILTPLKHDKVAVVIGGLATDYCVKATLLDAEAFSKHLYDNERTLDVYAITDTMRPVNEVTGGQAMAELTLAGVKMITSQDLIEGRVMKVEEFHHE